MNSRASILSCAVVGEGERSLWAAVENAQLTVFTAPAMCFASGPCRQPCVVGKAMLFRRSELQALDGLEVVKDLLATTTSSAASTPTLESWSSCHGCP